MFVETKDDRIVYVSSIRPENYEGEEYDGTGKVLMPGFVNAHSHSPMTLFARLCRKPAASALAERKGFSV